MFLLLLNQSINRATPHINWFETFCSSLTVSDIIEIVGIIASLITSIVAITISIVTMRQNSKMIEESTRAIIAIYGESINTGSPVFYFVIKNFGNSLATITKFTSDFDFTGCYGFKTGRNWIADLNNCTIAPGQSRICKIDYDKITRPITFDIEYISSGKKYIESMVVDLKAGADMVTTKTATKDKELRTISYTLQEMLQKNL